MHNPTKFGHVRLKGCPDICQAWSEHHLCQVSWRLTSKCGQCYIFFIFDIIQYGGRIFVLTGKKINGPQWETDKQYEQALDFCPNPKR